MTRTWVLTAAWIGTVLLLGLWTVVSYANTSNPDLQQEVLVRHSFLMILLSLPLGGLAALLIAGVVYLLGLQLAGIQDTWLVSIAYLIAGTCSGFDWFRGLEDVGNAHMGYLRVGLMGAGNGDLPPSSRTSLISRKSVDL
jgi:hypothetical protein